jgi:hypothetical protein
MAEYGYFWGYSIIKGIDSLKLSKSAAEALIIELLDGSF